MLKYWGGPGGGGEGGGEEKRTHFNDFGFVGAQGLGLALGRLGL